MDLEQEKLTKSEWNSIEIPLPDNEKRILKLIDNGFKNINIKENDTKTFISFLKISDIENMDDHIFSNYLQDDLIKIFKNYNATYDPVKFNSKKLCKADQIRFRNMEKNIIEKRNHIYEYKLIDLIECFLKNRTYTNLDSIKSFYTLKILVSQKIERTNSHLLKIVDILFDFYDSKISYPKLLYNAKEIIENNTDIISHMDLKLFNHQKELFSKVQSNNNKLIFYVAPTGTGKTLSPIGISNKYRIIFVCAVRHVGLALAKAAIQMNKCVAFAFGCNDVDQIKLHYFSAKEYIVNNKSGGILKVDNSIGDKVEIMISDIKSYKYAMNYMLSFNERNKLLLYWDEPTISLDYKEHFYHEIIKNNWNENLIGNIVLSSATLPKQEDLLNTIHSYKEKFGGEIHEIKTYDCNKSISLINRNGFIVSPHNISKTYDVLKKSILYLESNKTLLRYVDLQECINVIKYINDNKLYNNNIYSINKYFTNIDEININNIKIYYLLLLKNIGGNKWPSLYLEFEKSMKKKYDSTSYISTKDSWTLNGGPTIYISEDINKIAHFCIQNINIPANILNKISKTIDYNSELIKKISNIQRDYDDGISRDSERENKLANDRGIPNELRQLKKKIDLLSDNIKSVKLPEIYIPNTPDHLIKWARKFKRDTKNPPFVSEISESTVEKIMTIDDIEDIWKLLLLMGIGIFSKHKSSRYIETMKELAKNKKLYLIIASSDFIFGTNYQFDHCYIGKDLLNMTQEKIIQTLGRVGRNKISDNYSIRLRDDTLIEKIFFEDNDKIEIENMKKLFC